MDGSLLLWFGGRLRLGRFFLRLAAHGNVQRLLEELLLRFFLEVEVLPLEADIPGVGQDVGFRFGLQEPFQDVTQ